MLARKGVEALKTLKYERCRVFKEKKKTNFAGLSGTGRSYRETNKLCGTSENRNVGPRDRQGHDRRNEGVRIDLIRRSTSGIVNELFLITWPRVYYQFLSRAQSYLQKERKENFYGSHDKGLRES